MLDNGSIHTYRASSCLSAFSIGSKRGLPIQGLALAEQERYHVWPTMSVQERWQVAVELSMDIQYRPFPRERSTHQSLQVYFSLSSDHLGWSSDQS